MRSRMVLFTCVLPVSAGVFVAMNIGAPSSFWLARFLFFPADSILRFLTFLFDFSAGQWFVLEIILRIVPYGLFGFLIDGLLFHGKNKRYAVGSLLIGSGLFLSLAALNASRSLQERLFYSNHIKGVAMPSIPWILISVVLVWVGDKRLGVSSAVKERLARRKEGKQGQNDARECRGPSGAPRGGQRR